MKVLKSQIPHSNTLGETRKDTLRAGVRELPSASKGPDANGPGLALCDASQTRTRPVNTDCPLVE